MKKTRGRKMQKPENVLKSKMTNRQTTFKVTIRGERICFCTEAGTCINKRNLGFNLCMTIDVIKKDWKLQSA